MRVALSSRGRDVSPSHWRLAWLIARPPTPWDYVYTSKSRKYPPASKCLPAWVGVALDSRGSFLSYGSVYLLTDCTTSELLSVRVNDVGCQMKRTCNYLCERLGLFALGSVYVSLARTDVYRILTINSGEMGRQHMKARDVVRIRPGSGYNMKNN